MGKLPDTVGAARKGMSNAYEYRVHTLYGRVVPGASLPRWESDPDPRTVAKVESFAQKFLDRLPSELKYRQAFAFDIYVHPQEGLSLIEINTNHGEEGNWSGFLKEPKVFASYVRLLARDYGWKFDPAVATDIFSGLGNLKPFSKMEIDWYVDYVNHGDLTYPEGIAGLNRYMEKYLYPAKVRLKEQDLTGPYRAKLIGLIADIETQVKKLNPNKKDNNWTAFVVWVKSKLNEY
jgi:hypothetical protein